MSTIEDLDASRLALLADAAGRNGSRYAWRAHGECRKHPELDFHPVRGGNQHHAIAPLLEVCARCPVRDACLEAAMVHRERYGIWGGTTGKDRRALFAADTRRNNLGRVQRKILQHLSGGAHEGSIHDLAKALGLEYAKACHSIALLAERELIDTGRDELGAVTSIWLIDAGTYR